MSGIRERRFWEPGTRPSAVAARAGRLALEESGLAAGRIGCLIHASVCRDFLEPATASVVHRELGLAPGCTIFDLSNACLGFANALVLLGTMIEQGQIEAGLVVAGEDGGPLVEQTVEALLGDPRVGKPELKRAFASLTIGSGAAAAVVARAGPEANSRRLLGGVVRCATEHHELCAGDAADGGSGPLMETDSEALLEAGVALAQRTWGAFLEELGWEHREVERVVTHQVGAAHRRLLLASLELDPALDYPTVAVTGNVGSVSLPLSLDRARREGFLRTGQRTALLGIGSGLNCLMLGLDW